MEDRSSVEEQELRRVVVAELQATLLRIRTVETFLETWSTRAAQHVAAGAVCTFTLISRDGSSRWPAVTSAAAMRTGGVRQRTMARASTRCVTAWPASSWTCGTETRWPEWARPPALGFLSAAAVPADTGGGAQLALNLYGETTGAFGEVRCAGRSPTSMRRRAWCGCA